MPLYDILNEFQKGLSHIAVVIKLPSGRIEQPTNKGPSEGEYMMQYFSSIVYIV